MSDEKEVTLVKALEGVRAAIEKNKADLDAMADACPYEMKLAVTKWVMKHIVDHAKEGGSYRYLIYTRLGFNSDAYVPLCDDGLFISNEFDVDQLDGIKAKVREHKIDVLKPDVGFCDEPGCFRDAGCGWPSDTGYRWTCYEHHVEGKKNEQA